MTFKHLVSAIVAALAMLVGMACGATDTPVPIDPTPTNTPSPVVEAPTDSPPSVVSTPVPRSEVGTIFKNPLSSGLSVADVTENALPSVVQVVTASGSGTGFIVNESGLVVTNKHVVQAYNRVTLRMAAGNQYQGAVVRRDPNLDLAYVEIDSVQSFTPIAIGDSDKIRVGEEVIVIGFPLGKALGLEPTVSVGIISAKRADSLQTDAALNPGNSGGPLLDMFGQVAGVVVSRIDADNTGRAVSGIGFAIPINAVKQGLGRQVSPSGKALPTPVPTPFPTIGPTPDIQATKAAIEAIEEHQRQSEKATQTAIEAQQEAAQYAKSLEATRIARRPTPTPEPTPTHTPTPTPHPATFCEEWEVMVLDWIKQGNNYEILSGNWEVLNPDVPDHPQLPASLANEECMTNFPKGVLDGWEEVVIGYGGDQLLPGTYEYRGDNGDYRVKAVGGDSCPLSLNKKVGLTDRRLKLLHGEPFTFQFFQYHGTVGHLCYWGSLYRIGD